LGGIIVMTLTGFLGGCVGPSQEVLQLRQKVTVLEQTNNMMRGKVQALTDEVMESRQKLAQAPAQPAPDQARAELEARLRAMGIDVSENAEGALVVTLVNSILFDPGKANLKQSAEAALRKVAEEIKHQFPGHPIRIEGHTDNVPIRVGRTYKDNWELSSARGLSVLRYLTKKCGVPPQQLYVGAFSMYRPVKSNKTADGKAANRRVDIVILPRINVHRENIAQR
jgi:chemotaxis protein MotB